MSSLRVLLVDTDGRESARVTTLLSDANHCVLGASGLQEAAEALEIQKFDAVLLGASVPSTAMPEFAASLRELERRQKLDSRIPVLSISPCVAEEQGWSLSENSPPDGYLARRFGPETLASAIKILAHSIAVQAAQVDRGAQPFWPDEFREQCGNEPQLMAEIIDLFLLEQQDQFVAMVKALGNCQYEQLSYIAHTLKGSLGALHAKHARRWAESVEKAAKQRDTAGCETAMAALEDSLSELKPALWSFRAQIISG
jgi:HPt (histidine-containing phosphotransfer) domain-containing protein